MIKEVRNKGKRIYKSNFWKVVAVCFITAIMTGGSTIYLIRNEFYNRTVFTQAAHSFLFLFSKYHTNKAYHPEHVLLQVFP